MKRRLLCSKRLIYLFLLSIFTGLLWGCSGNTEIGNPEASSGLIAMNDEAELDAYLRDQLRADITADPVAPEGGGEDVDGGEIPGMEMPPEADLPPEPRNRVVADGNTFYVAENNRVVVLEVTETGEPETTAALPIRGTASALHLLGERLIIVSRVSNAAAEPIPGFSAEAHILLSIIDVSTPGNPRPVRDIRMEGEDLTSVERGGMLFLVQNFRPGFPIFEDRNAGTETPDITVRESLDRLESASLAELTPDFAILNADGDLIAFGPLLQPEDIVRPDRPTGGAMTVITAVDPEHPGDFPKSAALIANVDRVYPADAALYLSITQDCDDTADCEPDHPIQTFLYRAALDANRPRFTAAGSVWGRISLPGALYERNEVLWALSDLGFGSSNASLHTRLNGLRLMDGGMETLGSLDFESLSIPLRIRFFNDRAYLFSESGTITPLNLSDPLNPEMGEKFSVNGILTDLSPLNSDILIGIGTAVTPGDSGTALQISLIDVFNMQALDIIDQETQVLVEDGNGAARALDPPVLNAEKNWMAVPVVITDSIATQSDRFAGAFLFRLTNQNIERIGVLQVPDAVLAVADSLWILPRFTGGRLYLFHPGGVTHANPENPKIGPVTEWFTGV